VVNQIYCAIFDPLGTNLTANTVGVMSTTNFQGTARFFNTVLFGKHKWDYIINGGDVGFELAHVAEFAFNGSIVNGGVLHLVNMGPQQAIISATLYPTYNVTYGANAGITNKASEMVGCYSYKGYTYTNLSSHPVHIWQNYALSNSYNNLTMTNIPPMAYSQNIAVAKNMAKAITLTGSDTDGDALTYAIVTSPAYGVLSGSAPNITYTPATNYTGSDSFTFKVTDSKGAVSGNAVVSITVSPTTTVTFYSVGAYDGYVVESSETSNVGGARNETATDGAAIRVGDTGAKKQLKGFVSFNCSSLPDTCTITAATLKLKRGGGVGTPTTLGTITVDVKNVNTGWSDNVLLQTNDFQATASASSVATLSYPATTNAWATGALNATGLTKITTTTASHTQYRIRFTLDDDNDTADDYLGFYSGENAITTNRPILEVTYL
jgi:hypothetical protein